MDHLPLFFSLCTQRTDRETRNVVKFVIGHLQTILQTFPEVNKKSVDLEGHMVVVDL